MKQWHCCHAAQGLGFGVQYRTLLMRSEVKGAGRWLQFMHCAYLLSQSRYFECKFKGQGSGSRFGVRSSEFERRDRIRGMECRSQGEVIS